MTDSTAPRRRVSEETLRRALERQEFRLAFHPQIELVGGTITGFEALLRWHPAGGHDVPPDEFIPSLEDTGLISPVGIWVIDDACRQWRSWLARDALPDGCKLSINLSARQFADAGLAPVLLRTAAHYNIEPAALEIELTESTLMQDTAQTDHALADMQNAGIGLSVDDFGTGYCALAYLRRFRLDALKIDRLFVDHVTSDAKDYAIIESIIRLARILRLRTIAEGVETAQQLTALRRLHCDGAQGYLFARPLAADAVPEFVRRWEGIDQYTVGTAAWRERPGRG